MHDKKVTLGLQFALGAYASWGIAPVYFKAIAEVPAGEILAHRVVWSLVLLGAAAAVIHTRRRQQALALTNRLFRSHVVTAGLLSANWLIFIYAIQTQRLIEASLGYFINPLVSVLLGVVVLGERLSRRQWAAMFLAAVGISIPLFALGRFSWIAFALAISFGLYGLLRKRLDTDALSGLLVETLVASPFAVCYFFWLALGNELYFGHIGNELSLLLALSGVVTTIPLILFIEGARRLQLATVGVLQNIVPSLQFFLAVFLYEEPFEFIDGVTFGCIWLALLIYGWDLIARSGLESTTRPIQRRP